jgi:hypothetical protein
VDATDAVVPVAKSVVVMDHIKNNRIEYLLLAGLAHLMGWLDQASSMAAGMC